MLSDDELRAKLVATFKGELDEYLVALNRNLLELERSGLQEELLYDTFRTVHNLKGAAGAIGLIAIQQVAHSMENLFGAVRRGECDLGTPAVDLCYRGMDLIQTLVDKELAGASVPADISVEYQQKVDQLLQNLPPTALEPAGAAAAPLIAKAKKTSEASGTAAPPESIRISLGKIDRLMSDVGELLVSKNQYEQRFREIKQASHEMSIILKQWTRLRPLRRKLTKNADAKDLGSLFDTLDYLQGHLKNVNVWLTSFASRTSNDNVHLSVGVAEVQKEVQDLRMVPMETLFDPLWRQIRELARKHHKKVETDFRGGGTELDRQVVEAVRDPLMHIIRNCIDHGVELPQQRVKLGKKPEGTITLSAEQVGNQIVLTVADDGAGIDLARIRSQASAHGWFSEREVEMLNEQELLSVIFRPGFSTTQEITETSGRGVGLDVVKVNVERLQGHVAVHTNPGVGTLFRITLPLTLSTLHVLLIRCLGQMFALPVSAVERTLRVRADQAYTVESRTAVTIESRSISLLPLSALLGMQLAEAVPQPDFLTVLVLYQGAERAALIVDEVLGEQELVIKSLGKQLKKVRNISGGAVLGDGSVVLVLNPAELLRSARGDVQVTVTARPTRRARRKVLVVDDSITTRTLEKNILESAGYEVVTAKDGVEGLLLASTSACHLVITDIEMPGLNGFDLTRKLKNDPHLSHLPVILVSSRDAQQDRVRGVEVGADAYIVKGKFDQAVFLDLVSSMTS